jgi:hypothetical protein
MGAEALEILGGKARKQFVFRAAIDRNGATNPPIRAVIRKSRHDDLE